MIVRRCFSSRFLLCSNLRAYSWLILSSWAGASSSEPLALPESPSSNKLFFAILI